MARQLRIFPKFQMPPSHAVRVLVVEDDPAIRRLVYLVLDDLGLEVSVAADGVTAVEEAVSHRPQLVLLDFNLPGPDGEAVARELRARCGNVPILLLSAADNVRQKAQLVGAVSRLDKPFELSELEVSVTRALRVARLQARQHRVREDVNSASSPRAVPGAGSP